jgi:hypothetical protein
MDFLETRYAIGARKFLADRHAKRRQIPFTPIQCFELEKMTAPVGWTEAVKPTGVGNPKLET